MSEKGITAEEFPNLCALAGLIQSDFVISMYDGNFPTGYEEDLKVVDRYLGERSFKNVVEFANKPGVRGTGWDEIIDVMVACGILEE